MSTVSTFGSFSMAKLGIWASQKAMQVTGNNITNINTPGYTRQELKLDSLYVGGADRYASKWDSKVGSGVIVSGVRQIRSPYLDIRYRDQNTVTGHLEEQLNGLYGLNSILDEVGKGEDDEGVMEAAFQNMIEQLTHFNTSGAGEATFDTVFRGSVSEVLSLFNNYANRLERLYDNTKESLEQDVNTVNTILSNIRHLNVQIRKADIHGSNALELRDSRNMLIDELSKYMKINVIYDEEDIGSGIMVEKLTIRLDSADESKTENHNGALLVDGKYATQLKMPDVNVPEEFPAPEFQGTYDVTLDALRDEKGVLKWLVEPEATVLASDPGIWMQTDDKGNVTYTPQPAGPITIGGYTTNISAADTTKSDAENVEAQLREFCAAYNTDPKNTLFRAAISLDKNSVIFTAIDSEVTPAIPADVDTTQITALTGNGQLTIGGYTADIVYNNTVAAADQLEDQLKQFMDAYNSDTKNAPNRAYLDGTTMKFDGKPLTQSGELIINGYSAFIKGAENMTREQQLAAFRDVYNKDPENDPKSATLSADGKQLIFKQDSQSGPVDPNSYPSNYDPTNNTPADTHVVKLGIKGMPDPENVEVELTDTDLYGALQAKRELLTEEGEFASREDLIRDPKASTKRGIPYYQKIWDAMARKFAETLNDANTLEDAATGDLKRGANGGYIVEPSNYYLTDKNGNYIDADGNIITGDPDNPYSYKEYYTTKVDINGTETEVYADKDGKPLLSDVNDPTSYIKTGDPDESYIVYKKNEAGQFLDAAGNVLTPNADGTYTSYLKDASGRYLNNKGQVIAPNPDGSYVQYKQNASNQFVADDGVTVIDPNSDGSYWDYETNANGDYVDAAGNPLTPNPGADTYWAYKTNDDGKFVDKDGNVLTPNADDNGSYVAYKTVTDEDGTEWYVDKDDNKLDKVGNGAIPGDAVSLGDQRVYSDVDMRVPKKNAEGVPIDRRVAAKDDDGNDIDRRVEVDPRAFTDTRIGAIKGDKRVVREQFRGGVLISNSGNSNDPEGITAKNISIALGWSSDAIHVMQSRDNTELDQSTANSNIRHMISIVQDNNYHFDYSDFDGAFETPNADASYFDGSFADLMTKICSTLADDTRISENNLLNSNDALTELATDRDSVSGVDLNDEAINMMQYNKSYSAACRYMTTLDEMLDKLINGTAI